MQSIGRHNLTQSQPAGAAQAETAALAPKPVAGSLLAGLIASACCGGTLLFASIGLGAFYSALGLARYIPQALTLGALSVVAINYCFFRLAAARNGSPAVAGRLRQRMFLSAGIGLVAMLGSFVLLTWLEHGVVRAARFMSNPTYARALIPGVPNGSLVVALVCVVMALLLLWALPFPYLATGAGVLRRIGQTAVLGATAVLVAFVVASTIGLAPAIATGHSASHHEPAAGHSDQMGGSGQHH
jgi:hypothetical protein